MASDEPLKFPHAGTQESVLDLLSKRKPENHSAAMLNSPALSACLGRLLTNPADWPASCLQANVELADVGCGSLMIGVPSSDPQFLAS